MNIDRELFDVYESLASRAPSGDRIRAAVAGRIKAHRQRRLLIGAGGAAAALAALGAPALLWLRDDPTALEALLRPVHGRGYPMPFTPSWLPDGYTLTEREVTTNALGRQQRVWQLDPPRRFPKITLDLTVADPAPLPSSSTVTINAASGWLRQGHYFASCSWEPLAGVQLVVSLSNQPDDTDRGAEYAEIVLRIARSADRSRVEYLQPTMSFGWLPESVPLRRAFGTFTSAGHRAEGVTAYAQNSRQVIWAGISDPQEEDMHPGGVEQITLRGRPALYHPPDPQIKDPYPGSFALQLPNGRWLSAAGYPAAGQMTLTKAELARIVETLQIGPSLVQ